MQDYQRVYKNGQEVEPVLPFSSLYALLEAHAARYGEKEALVFLDVDTDIKESYSYQDLFAITKHLATLLQKRYHLQKGDAVALHLGNSPRLLFLHLACWMAGLITVPLDLKRDTLERKRYKITSTNAKLIAGSGGAEEKLLQEKVPTVPLLTEYEREVGDEDFNSTDSLKETALILFTSGTTANPKGVALSAENIFLNADGIAEWLKITESDRFFIVLPLHHINSTTMSMATLLKGGTVVLATRYSKSKFFKLMAEQACTLSSIVPTICLDLLSEQEQFRLYEDQLRQVSRIQIGSAPVVQKDVLAFIQSYHIPLVQGYGSTETALRVSGVQPWGSENQEYMALVEKNTIGSELKWNNLTVMLASGTEAQEHEEGEICARGPILTSGYLHDTEATRKAFYGGWFHTGDIGYWENIHGTKQYFISGRAKEIIIKGGVNISPLAVEDAILKTFSEVKTCFVVGVPDARFGEEVAAVLVFHKAIPAAKQEEVVNKLYANRKTEEIGILPYESPKYIFVTDERLLPKTSTGKVQRVTISSYTSALLQPIRETEHYTFRQLTPFDTGHLTTGVMIHNTRWGKALAVTQETVELAAAHGIVIGAINKQTQDLQGLLFGVRVASADVENLEPWLQTYDSATAQMTLKTNNPKGDSLLLVSIATEGRGFEQEVDEAVYQSLREKAPAIISDYVPHDLVLQFHSQAKAGLQQGASVLHIVANSRPQDTAALGYNVIMKYPLLATKPVISQEATLGTQLIEAAMLYAYQKGVQTIYAYSRPAGLLRYVQEKVR